VKIANPRLYIFTRPNMSPIRPKVTTSTAITTRYPISIHSRKLVFDETRGLMWMPRKIAGSEMRTIDESIVAIKIPIVVFERAIHL
jgi:hypothetical protein